MTTANTALRVTELDFDSIRTNLKNYLRSQSEFQDFDFDGSGMSVLIDLLAYNTHYMGYYINMLGNESFLDTSQLRASVLSHAKAIGYVPKSKQGATAKINLVVTPSDAENNTVTTLVLDKYTPFIGADIDGTNYQFVAVNSNTATKSGGSFSFSNVVIKQGEVVTLQYDMTPTNTKRRFEIPSANVDLSTLIVTVQESSSNLYTTQYTRNEDITLINANSTVYFIEENENLNYSLYFGDDVLGKKPKNGNIITCTFLETQGAGTNSISQFAIAGQKIGGLYRDNVSITSVTSSIGGIDKESIEQVKYRAPYFYTTQNRAVTPQDFETLILKDYPSIDAVSVWGGEDNDPIVYGKVYISLKTTGNYTLSVADKDSIKEKLIAERNIITITPEIVDPDYVYLRVLGTVRYNPTLTSYNSGQLLNLVKAAVADYNDTELNSFDSTFRKSKLQYLIENSEKSITGSDITMFAQKRLTLNTITSSRYNIKFNMPLRKGNYLNRITSFPAIITNDSNGIARNTLFEEILDAPTGINSIDIVNPGSNYTSAPTVTIVGDGFGATATATTIGGRITSIQITNKGADYTKAEVILSGGEGSGAVVKAKLESNYGTIRSFYYSSSGDKISINPNAGLINYSEGSITLNSLITTGSVENDFYQENIVTFFAPVQSEIISPLRNRILTIDEADSKSIQIEMVAES